MGDRQAYDIIFNLGAPFNCSQSLQKPNAIPSFFREVDFRGDYMILEPGRCIARLPRRVFPQIGSIPEERGNGFVLCRYPQALRGTASQGIRIDDLKAGQSQ